MGRLYNISKNMVKRTLHTIDKKRTLHTIDKIHIYKKILLK